jgi:acyl transferase domain-containing protein/acyl carrier protein
MTDHEETPAEAIAIIAMAGRFPGASDVDQYWHNLLDGVESITFFDDEQLRAAGTPQRLLDDPHFVRANPIINDVDMFDAGYFRVNAREAEILDPQHRVLLEVCADALQIAGYDPHRYDGRIGVFAGARDNDYLEQNVGTHPELIETIGSLVTILSNDTDYVATGIAYRLDLRGPAVTMVTACSTSLVAIHYATRALRAGECEMALAGGVEIGLPVISGYEYSPGSIFSPDGRVRAFDASASGTVFGAGAGIVMLKPLAAAIADNDSILAVIRGSAVNNDGADKTAFSTPSSRGQQRAVRAALSDAGVNPATIGYVEAHGTGTSVGDPLELDALATAYESLDDAPGRCAISSVKSNIGHLGAAAGVAGLIKAAQCVRTGLLPPIINITEPNPAIDLDHGMFRINTELESWPTGPTRRRAGVSSFGIGGTNAHLILEEPPPPAPASPPARARQLIALSARSVPALDDLTRRVGAQLRADPDLELADVAFSLAVGRPELDVRRTFTAADTAELAQLITQSGDRLRAETPGASNARATLLFPGQGVQYPGMARGLFDQDAAFRTSLQRCADLLEVSHGLDLLSLLFADATDDPTRLDQTRITQPAIFAVEYSLATMLRAWGVDVADLAGHSVGEYVAACVAGVFDLPDALALVADRGQLMQSLPPGSMLAVSLPEELLAPLLPDTLDIAAVNSPDLTVVSGPSDEIEQFAGLLVGLGTSARPVRTSHAFHSRMMVRILDEFRARLDKITLSAPTMPYVSNVTGDWIKPEQATDPDYWVRHLRGCVRFGDTLALLTGQRNRLLLEVGPGRTLATFAAAHQSDGRPAAVIATMRPAQQQRDDLDVALASLGSFWSRGGVVDWNRHWAGDGRRRVALPTYPYQRERFWIERAETSPGSRAAAAEDTDTSPFTIPTWRQVSVPTRADIAAADVSGAVYLVLAPRRSAELDEVVHRLRAAGAEVVVGRDGDEYVERNDGSRTIRPGVVEDVQLLVSEVATLAALTGTDEVRIVHAWTLGPRPDGTTEAGYASRWIELGFVSALLVLQQAARRLPGLRQRLIVVSSGMQDVSGSGGVEPAKAALVGLVRTAGKEFEGLSARSVDLVDNVGDRDRRWLVDQLQAELVLAPDADFVAYRNGRRWVATRAEIRLEAGPGIPEALVDRGVYVISGGLGGLGLVLAENLGRLVGARLVLLGRNALPERDEWPRVLAGDDRGTADRIRGVLAAEHAGADVLVASCDVTDVASLERVRAQVESRFGRVDGVFHLAALPGGAMLETRDLDEARALFRPKVEGVYALEEVFQPELMVLYSSIAAVSGDFGLGDYSSANAVLDSFAHSRWARGRNVLSINMPPWAEVGMAFAIDSPAVLSDVRDEGELAVVVDHPLLTRKLVHGSGQVSYAINLSHRSWVLADHVLGGCPTMPGTGIIELLRAATADLTGQPVTIIEGLVLARPLMALRGFAARVKLQPRDDGGYDATITGGSDTVPIADYAHAVVRGADAVDGPVVDLDAVRTECVEPVRTSDVVRINHDTGMLVFGERWDALASLYRSDRTELIEACVAERFRGDLDSYPLHPAQLDICLAVGQTLVPDGNFLPFSYDRIAIYAPMPARCYSVIRHRPDLTPGATSADISVVDEAGRAVLTVEKFTMLVVDDKATKSMADLFGDAGRRGEAPARDLIDVAELLDPNAAETGVYSVEGLEGLRRILVSMPGPQVTWSTEGIRRRVQRTNRINRVSVTEQIYATGVSTSGNRPLTTPCVSPSTAAEATICALWQDALGIDEIGIDDDFFDLGGNSLTAVQLVSRIADQFRTELAVAELFDARTPRVLAVHIEERLIEQVGAMTEDEAVAALRQLDPTD